MFEVDSCERELHDLREAPETTEQSRSKVVTEVVTPITDVVHGKFETDEVAIEELWQEPRHLDGKIGRCLSLIEAAMSQMSSSTQNEHTSQKNVNVSPAWFLASWAA